MKRQSGITLVEVLVAILIMGVGLLAIFTLFPIGLLNYRQAMQDDRVVQAATNANSIALARNIRHDINVETAFANGQTLVYVDAFYQNIAGNLGGSIPRCTITGAKPTRWFALLDDFEFNQDGTPVANAGIVESKGYYTWAYLLRRPRANDRSFTDMAVVVYGGRTVAVAEGETVLPALGSIDGAGLTVTGTPAISRTGWVLDLTPDATGNPTGQFYRIVSVTPNGATTFLETQIPLRSDVKSILVMENVIEVLERGTGWEP
jgi:type II secretory pathway pseudopilin PulG